MKKIKTTLLEFINENIHNLPDDIRSTLEEYSHFYVPRFDWNKMTDKHGEDFNDWLETHEEQGFKENIDTLIEKTRQDLIIHKKRQIAERALEKFEELIIPVLGNRALIKPLSKFEVDALLYINDIEELNKTFTKAKDIIDKHGDIDKSKIETSDIFGRDIISLPNFERFVEENPDFKGVFEDWKKLFDRMVELSLEDLNAFRSSTTYNDIKKLYDYLIKIRN